ncbi:hypothetical protein O0235_06250 [Tepidiforma flava]|uniref:Uncharacterized protein n=1 Tax=Tepidiforma flava TaxID=3004094 RepID=A0ABY7MAS9_9CHLR|nr:hypothetical protein [Tepidiforma flava]WBL37167.1 hypothetical protein O0235_06250 [Tepidiforma flava]
MNLGGGIPHPYRPGAPAYPLEEYGAILADGVRQLSAARGAADRHRNRAGALPGGGDGAARRAA